MSVNLQKGAIDAATQEIQRQAERLERRIERDFDIIGTKAVNLARSMATESPQGNGTPYTVQTGNLVSSIGYCLSKDGQIVGQSQFNAVSGPKGDGVEGSLTGRQLAETIASQFPQGYALILVAGMHYASYVQELYHRDVLASGTLLAEKLVNELWAELNKGNE